MNWGSSIYAKVLAQNIYGNSIFSPVGNGALILTNPDSPTALTENVLLRTATSLGLTWN